MKGVRNHRTTGKRNSVLGVPRHGGRGEARRCGGRVRARRRCLRVDSRSAKRLGQGRPTAAEAPPSSGTLTLVLGSPWGTSWSFNPYRPNFPVMGGAIDLPLALQNPPVMTDYVPQLATSWTVRGRQLTVRLRVNAEWQNGKAFTSKDVYDTLVLDGLEGAAIWNDISCLATEVPYLEYGYKINQIEYLTNTFEDWPPRSSVAFKSLYYNDLALMLEDGYV